jgi:CRISPR-associated protein Csm1
MQHHHTILYHAFCVLTDNTPYSGARNSLLQSQEADETAKQLIARAIARATAGQKADKTQQRVKCIFTNLTISKAGVAKSTPLPLLPLSFTDEFVNPQAGSISVDQLKKQFDEACLHALKPVEADFSTWLERAVNLLSVFAVRYPCGYEGLEDVSFYDHVRAVLAFTDCLARGKQDTFQFVGGDLSGIQKYIYDILSRKAARNLKGRSFYLHILVDDVVRTILHEFQLLDFQVIYASGGGFYLIAPSVEDFDSRFAELKAEVFRKLYDIHDTRLFLALESVEVPFAWAEQDKGQGLKKCWEQVSKKLNERKRSRYAEQIVGEYHRFFEPFGTGAQARRDDITGEEISLKEKPQCINPEDSQEERLFVSPTTYQNLQLAGALMDHATRGWAVGTERLTPSKEFDDFEIVNFYYRFGDSKALEKRSLRTYAVNQPEFWKQQADGFQLYGGNRVPRDGQGRLKGFDQLVESDQEGHFRRMGVLRMDVDNLGDLFIRGFDSGVRSFSRYHALSRQLDYFFKGYLNTIWSQDESYKNHTLIIYSGGDDLFIVGRWDVLLRLAREINKRSRQWVQHAPHLTLSGGLAIVGAKFPIARSAQLAEELEKQAKDHTSGPESAKQEKNAFAFMGRAFTWDTELEQMWALKERFTQAGLGNGAHSLLRKVQAHAEFALTNRKQAENRAVKSKKRFLDEIARIRKQAKEEIAELEREYARKPQQALKAEIDKVTQGMASIEQELAKDMAASDWMQYADLRWWWLLAYDMARFEERYRKSDSSKADILALINELKHLQVPDSSTGTKQPTVETNYQRLQDHAFAARWAELELRSSPSTQ